MSVSIIIQLLKSNLFSWWCEVCVSHSSIWLRDHLEIYGRLRCQEWIILDEYLMKAQLQILIELSHQLPKQKGILFPCPAGATPNKIKPSQSSRLKIFSNVSKSRNYADPLSPCSQIQLIATALFPYSTTWYVQIAQFQRNLHFSGWCSRHKITLLQKSAKKLSKRMQIFRFLN